MGLWLLIAAVFVATSESAASSASIIRRTAATGTISGYSQRLPHRSQFFATKSRNFKKDASVLTLEHYAPLMRS
jgi:hypothetical protein